MSSGITSKGTDLDSIFVPYSSGTSPGTTGYKSAGSDIRTRYQPISLLQAGPTGLTCKVGGSGSFVDLCTLFDPAGGSTGGSYNVLVSLAPADGTGTAQIVYTATTSTWTVSGSISFNGGASSPATPSGTPLSGSIPSGATAVRYLVGASEGTTAGSISNGASGNTNLTAGGIVFSLTNDGARITPNIAQYPVTVAWYAGSTLLSYVTVTLAAQVRAVG